MLAVHPSSTWSCSSTGACVAIRPKFHQITRASRLLPPSEAVLWWLGAHVLVRRPWHASRVPPSWSTCSSIGGAILLEQVILSQNVPEARFVLSIFITRGLGYNRLPYVGDVVEAVLIIK